MVPGASASGIAGWLGDSLKVRVSAPPEKGLANKAVEALLCELLEIPSATIRIVSGRSSAHKLVQIDSLSAAELRSRLSRYS